MSLFRHKLYLSATLGHFTIDVFNSMGPVLVTFLSIPMALTATQIGLAIGAYQLIGAVTQPPFGWLTDKLGSRWLGPLSVTWTISFLTLAVFLAQGTQNFYPFFIAFGLAAVGSGAFHPQGAMHAGTAVASRAATGTAIFFLFGQGGLATGPMIGGLILDKLGPGGIYGLALLTLPFLFFMAYAMRGARPEGPEPDRPDPGLTLSPRQTIQWAAIGLLAVLIGLRSWAFLGTVSFLPKLFQEMGWNATYYGLITGFFWMSSAVAGVIAGHLADRWGRRQVIFTTLLLGSIPLYFIPVNSGWAAFPLTILAGGLLGASQSILVVIAQALLPGRKGLASGLTLGYMFGVGAFAAWGVGLLADGWGLAPVIQAGTGIAILAALLALLLPATQEVARPQVEGVPV